MELTLEHHLDERAARQRLRRVFRVFFAPTYVRYALYIVMFILLGLRLPSFHRDLFFIFAAAYAVLIFLWFPRYWRVYRNLFRKTGAFERPSVIRLTDTGIETVCGENRSKNEYRVFSDYLECKDFIALICQKSISAIFPKTEFPDGGREFMQCLDRAGVRKIRLRSFKRWWSLCIPLVLIAGSFFFGSGRFGRSYDKTYRFPANAAAQIRKAVACRGPMLMIPVAWPKGLEEKREITLDAPVEVRFPFEDLPKLTGYQYAGEGYFWDTGENGLLTGFLLVGSDGTLFFMRPPIMSFGDNLDIQFFKAEFSPAWKKEFELCLNSDSWPCQSDLWAILGLEATCRWRKPETSRPVLRKFLTAHPLAAKAKAGIWQSRCYPCFTPNVYCEAKTHPMPRFTEHEVLLMRAVPTKKPGEDEPETELVFPNGRSPAHVVELKRELGALWATGQYRIVAYDRRAEKDVDDPERDYPWAPALRCYAAELGIPLVILYGKDDHAPNYPGLPKNVKQYWQCPGCMAAQMRRPHRTGSK
ncbi:MAG: hypothetical protein J5806_03875 [Lentisphaeria bacterium]|nr:hypothetical protein [Lentisphaeria bacterium]